MSDPTTNKHEAYRLLDGLKDWYAKRGIKINAWIDTIPIYDSSGHRLAVRYEVKSDILFSVDNILSTKTIS